MDEDRSSTVYKTMMIVLPHSDSPNAQDQQQQQTEQVKNTNSYKVIISEKTP